MLQFALYRENPITVFLNPRIQTWEIVEQDLLSLSVCLFVCSSVCLSFFLASLSLSLSLSLTHTHTHTYVHQTELLYRPYSPPYNQNHENNKVSFTQCQNLCISFITWKSGLDLMKMKTDPPRDMCGSSMSASRVSIYRLVNIT